jgi:hypothetical protein
MTALSTGNKIKYSFYSALVFFLIGNPETYKFTNSIFGSIIGNFANTKAGVSSSYTADRDGSPSPFGFFLHTFLFFLTILALMAFPRD